jgi:hypothetical protein
MSCRRREMTVTSLRLNEGLTLSRLALYGQLADELDRDSWAAASRAQADFP